MGVSPDKANLSYSYLDVSFSCNVAQNLSFSYFPILFPLGIIWSIFFQQAQIMLSAAHDTAHNRLYSGFLQRCAGTDFWPQSNSGGSAPEDTTRSPPGFLVRQEVSRQKHRAANRSHGIQIPESNVISRQVHWPEPSIFNIAQKYRQVLLLCPRPRQLVHQPR